jgi:hypothetical protein
VPTRPDRAVDNHETGRQVEELNGLVQKHRYVNRLPRPALACATARVRCRTHLPPPGTARQRQEVEEPDQRPSQAPPTKATPDAAASGMPATATPQRTRSPPQHRPDASRTKV